MRTTLSVVLGAALAALGLVACPPAGPDPRLATISANVSAVPDLGADEARPPPVAEPSPEYSGRVAPRSSTAAPVAPGPGAAPSPATLACLRSREGAYTSAIGNGYYGAYQYLPATWAWAVAGAAGVAEDLETAAFLMELVDVLASDAPPWAQDAAAAWALAQPGGANHWPTMRYCSGL